MSNVFFYFFRRVSKFCALLCSFLFSVQIVEGIKTRDFSFQMRIFFLPLYCSGFDENQMIIWSFWRLGVQILLKFRGTVEYYFYGQFLYRPNRCYFSASFIVIYYIHPFRCHFRLNTPLARNAGASAFLVSSITTWLMAALCDVARTTVKECLPRKPYKVRIHEIMRTLFGEITKLIRHKVVMLIIRLFISSKW